MKPNTPKPLNEGTTNEQNPNPTDSAGDNISPAPTGPGNQTQSLTGRSIEYWPIEDIKPHAMNATLYGDTCDEALVESIRENGILDPVAIQPDGTLLGGHRRLAAAAKLGLKTVPVHIMPIPADSDPVSLIIELNIKRPKTYEMKVREFAALLAIARKKAKARQGKRNIRPNLAGCQSAPTLDSAAEKEKAECGRARDIAAVKVGLKHATAEKGLKVIAVIDEHTGTADARDLLDIMNRRSVDAAFKRAQAIGWIERKPRKPKKPKAGGEEEGNPQTKDEARLNAEPPPTEKPYAPPANQDQPTQAATPPTPVTPPADVPATTPTSGKPRHVAEQFVFNFAKGCSLSVEGWCNGLISEQRVREELESIAENPKGDSPHDVTETQRFTVQLAAFVNRIAPLKAANASLSNLQDAAGWVADTIGAILRGQLKV